MKKKKGTEFTFTNEPFEAMDYFIENVADEMLQDQEIRAEIKGRIRAAMLRHGQELMSPTEIKGFLNTLPMVEITTTIRFG